MVKFGTRLEKSGEIWGLLVLLYRNGYTRHYLVKNVEKWLVT